jgi:C1A family cysteine protease
MRFIEFAKTYQDILHFNAQPNQTSTVGLNKFADWTAAERKQIANYRPRDQIVGTTKLLDTADLPTEVDWIKQGAVNAVQDQGQCGSCWAFSAIAQMEGQHFIQSGKLLKLSEQQCVDCDSESFGCNGGWQDNCMYYVQDNGGISLEADYPYRAMTDSCFADYNGPVSVKSVNHVKSYSESQLMAAIAQGPVSVTIDAS